MARKTKQQPQDSFIRKSIWMGTTRQQLIAAACNDDQNIIKCLSTDLPASFAGQNKQAYWFVLDLRTNQVKDLHDVARENNVKLVY